MRLLPVCFIATSAGFIASPRALSRDWDVVRDFRADRFPDNWTYQGAPPGSDDYIDLIQPPPGTRDTNGTLMADAWIEPGRISGGMYQSVLSMSLIPGRDGLLFVHPEIDMDGVIAWTAPSDGTVWIRGLVRLFDDGCGFLSNGVRWRLLSKSKEEWSAVLPSAQTVDFSLKVQVVAGDVLRFREDAQGATPCDHGYISVQIEYLNRFSRGDATDDGQLDIADPINVLSYLFTAGDEPDCLEAADADDNGRIDITDAIGLLEFLFQGSSPPKAPFKNCDFDPTLDELGCTSFSACEE